MGGGSWTRGAACRHTTAPVRSICSWHDVTKCGGRQQNAPQSSTAGLLQVMGVLTLLSTFAAAPLAWNLLSVSSSQRRSINVQSEDKHFSVRALAKALLNTIDKIGRFCRTMKNRPIFARDSIYAKRAYAIAIPSVLLSVRHTGGSVKNG